MAQGQMQLAMEETVARKGRDERAIRWLIDNLTEDAEMEQFLLAIPGSFNTEWGTEVWKRVGKHDESEDQSQDEPVARPHRDTTGHQPSFSWIIRRVLRPIIHLVRRPTLGHSRTHATSRSPVPHLPSVHPRSTTAHIGGENVVHELSTRIARSVEICTNQERFSNTDGLWRKRSRACIEATASLVFCANANLASFGGISKLLGDIGRFEKIRELSLKGADELFVTRWTCLSLVAIRPILADEWVKYLARRTVECFAEHDGTGNNDALEAAQKMDETLQKASDCLILLYGALRETEDLTKDVNEILRGHESSISELEQINYEADRLERVDDHISDMRHIINDRSHQITSQIPGILDDLDRAPIPFNRLVELSRDHRKMQFIYPRQILKSMCSPSLTLRNILEGKGDADAYKELLKNLENFRFWSSWRGDKMQRVLASAGFG
jgi:hypothetical protein